MSLSTLVSNLATRIATECKAIRAEIAALGTSASTANAIVRRNASGGFETAHVGILDDTNSAQGYFAARKDYVDALGTHENTPGTVMRRDPTYGTVVVSAVGIVNAPTDPGHATRKDYVDALGTTAASPSTVARRDVNGYLAAVGFVATTGSISSPSAPTAADHVTRKDYVDTGDTAAKARANHTGTQSLDTTTDSATRLAMTSAERTKLTGIATGATANSSDATLLARANHTGSQATSTITGLDTALSAKAPLASPAFTGTPTGITKTHVGLGSVDNTADTAKPVSTAQQTALNAKAPLASPAFTGTPTGITKAHVGLGSVDNTADTAKPVSTAQQTAISGRDRTLGDAYLAATATINTAWQVMASVTATSDGGPVAVRWSGTAFNAASGANRTMSMRLTCDGVALVTFSNMEVPLTGMPRVSRAAAHKHTPSAASHVWQVEMDASAGAAVVAEAAVLSVVEVS